MEAQTRLLRVLQEGEYTTVGGRTPIKTDVRIIAATHRDLKTQIQQGLFREDLFYRLNVVPLRLPPLRERLEDIADLVRHFLRIAEKEGLPPKSYRDGGASSGSSAITGRATCASSRTSSAACRRSIPQDIVTADIVENELAEPRRAADRRRGRAARRSVRVASSAISSGYFASFGRELPPPGLYDRMLRKVELPADHGGARRHPRQPDPRRRSARSQPQYLAQEDPRSRHQGH